MEVKIDLFVSFYSLLELDSNQISIHSMAKLYMVLFEISKLLNWGLDKKTLSILVSLAENGINPEAIAAVYIELKRETAALKVSNSANGLSCGGIFCNEKEVINQIHFLIALLYWFAFKLYSNLIRCNFKIIKDNLYII